MYNDTENITKEIIMEHTQYYNEQIGSLIKDYRIKKEMTQFELARKAGITRARLQKYETGVNTMTMEMFIHLCKALEIDYVKALQKIDWSML